MPQLDVSTYPSLVFWLFVSLAILFIGLQWIIIPRFERVFKERADKINSLTSEMRQHQTETQLLQDAIKTKVEDLRSTLDAQMTETVARLTKNITESENTFLRELQSYEAATKAGILSQHQTLKAELTNEIPTLIQTIVQRLLEEDVSRDDIEKRLRFLRQEAA